MKLKLFVLAAIAAACVSSCKNNSKAPDEGTVKGQVYTDSTLGWTITIPQGWEMMTHAQLKALEQKGSDALQQSTGKKISTTDLKYLVNFRKDQFNTFSATLQPFDGTQQQYDSNTVSVDNLLYQTFKSQGIPADTASGKATIQGLNFRVFYCTINNPNGGVLLQEALFSRFMNGNDFGISITYNNDENKKAMMDALMNSSFSKK